MSDIKKQAEETTTILDGSPKMGYITRKEGVQLTQNDKTKPSLGTVNTVGVSVGTTVNLGNFESYRIDCWATTEILAGETAKQAIEKVQKVLDNHVYEVRKQVLGGE